MYRTLIIKNQQIELNRLQQAAAEAEQRAKVNLEQKLIFGIMLYIATYSCTAVREYSRHHGLLTEYTLSHQLFSAFVVTCVVMET